MRPDEPVSRIMTEAVVAIEIDRPASEVLDCLLQYPIHHLPVVRGGRLVGMLSSADAMKLEFFLPRTAADTVRFLDSRVTVERLMRTPVISVGPAMSISEAAERMVGAGVHALPVVAPAREPEGAPTEESHVEPRYQLKPSDQEYRTALRAAEEMHIEERDPRFLGKTLLYLEQRRRYLEEAFKLADRFLRADQDELTHALLLKSIHAAKRAEERATGQARVPFPLE